MAHSRCTVAINCEAQKMGEWQLNGLKLIGRSEEPIVAKFDPSFGFLFTTDHGMESLVEFAPLKLMKKVAVVLEFMNQEGLSRSVMSKIEAHPKKYEAYGDYHIKVEVQNIDQITVKIKKDTDAVNDARALTVVYACKNKL